MNLFKGRFAVQSSNAPYAPLWGLPDTTRTTRYAGGVFIYWSLSEAHRLSLSRRTGIDGGKIAPSSSYRPPRSAAVIAAGGPHCLNHSSAIIMKLLTLPNTS